MKTGATRRQRRWTRKSRDVGRYLSAIWSKDILKDNWGLRYLFGEPSKHKRRKIQRGYGATRNQGSADSATVSFNGWRGRAA